ncbi:MAG: rhodanese-like domain-containing protein [Woeseiaceae bacterium]|nr:rhodanese-like domain-containing protein [Woeseiaceae bacterium]
MEQYLEFAANHTILVAGLVLSFFVVVFTELQRKARGVTSVEPQDAVGLINADAVVIDLRSREAFERGHIVNAKNIPYDELTARTDQLEKYGDKPIVAVCDAGTVSTRIVGKLRKSGAENIYGLRGGINAWSQASLPLVSGRKSKKKQKGRDQG